MPTTISLPVTPIPRRHATLVEGPHFLLDYQVRSNARFDGLDPFADWTRTPEAHPADPDEVRLALQRELPERLDSDPPGVRKRMSRQPTVFGEQPVRRVLLDWSAPVWSVDRAVLLRAAKGGGRHPVWALFAQDPAVPSPEQVTTIERRRYRWGPSYWLDVVLLDVGTAIEFDGPLTPDAEPFASWSGTPTADARLLELGLAPTGPDDRATAEFFEEFGAPREVLIQLPAFRLVPFRPWLALSELVRRQAALQEAATHRRPLDPSWEPLEPGETTVERGFGSLGLQSDGRPVLQITLWDAIALRYAEALADGRVRNCQALVARSRTERCGRLFIARRKDEQAYCGTNCRARMYQRDRYESMKTHRADHAMEHRHR